jgi:hypothetical protein
MSFVKLYEYIKPLIDIYIYKYFGEKKDFIFAMFKRLDIKAVENAGNSSIKFETCQMFYKLYYYIIFIFFIILIIWTIYYTLHINSMALSYNIGLLFKDQIKLKEILAFRQIDNLIYITDNFSFDYILFFYLFLIILILGISYYYSSILNIPEVYKEFNLLLPLLLLILLIGIIYYFYNYTFLNLLSKRANSLKNLFYDNINLDFITEHQLCNYSHKKDKFDDYFVIDKCNDIKPNFNLKKLFEYITNVINEIYNQDNEITLEKFKKLQDKNGILYKDKLSSAFFTFVLIRYYIDNNLLDDAKELFSTNNLNSLLPRVNPVLSLNYDSLIFASSNGLTYDMPQMQKAFNNNKDIYNYVYNDFYNNNSQIQEFIIDIYNICKYKMISVYDYYIIIGIIMLFIVIYYFIHHYYYPDKK